MDVAKPAEQRRKQKRKRILAGSGAIAVVVVAGMLMISIRPAIPTVAANNVWSGTVRRGPMAREVHGSGSLVPELNRWISAAVPGQLASISLKPGARVETDTLILTLTNPELEYETREAESLVEAAAADLAELRFQLEQRVIDGKASQARLKTEFELAQLNAHRDRQLAEQGVQPEMTAGISELKAKSLAELLELETRQLTQIQTALSARLESKRNRIAQLEDAAQLKRDRFEALKVKAGMSGVLQELSVEVGHRVASGDILARIVDPGSLMATVRVSQNRTRGLKAGLEAVIDTHSGTIQARVKRIDPGVKEGMVAVDLTLQGDFPEVARPDLAIEAVIILERITDTLFVDRPVFANAHSQADVFQLMAGSNRAKRVRVHFGSRSVSSIEILEGLVEGDQIILSDTSAYTDAEHIAIKD